jgi:transposase InsO family protein
LTVAVAACLPARGMVAAVCRATGISRASLQRHRAGQAAPPTIPGPRPKPARALSTPQQQAVLDLLHAPRFADQAPAEIYASLLDEGVYHCSIRTMYRILGQHGEVRERRAQLRHPAYQKPELLAERPNQVWSWDITKLMGPAKWSYFYLYVILDIFSRRVVGWCIGDVETAALFKPLLQDAVAKHQVAPGQLTLHADRGGPMKAKATAFLLADLGVTRSHNRPHTANGRVGDWRGGARRGGVAVGRRLSPYAGASFPAVRSVSSHRSSNRTCRFPASGFLPARQTFALNRSMHRLGTPLKPRVDRRASGLWRNPVLRCPMRHGNQP